MEKLAAYCQSALQNKGYHRDERYTKRLKLELAECRGKRKADGLWRLHNVWLDYAIKHPEYTDRPQNENNLLLTELLGVTQPADIDREPNSKQGDFPDIDVDFIKEVRDYLKTDYIPKTFGEDKVCNISNYTTYGIRSALIDMARVHGESREEIMAITKKLEGKDEEGDPLTWESALKLHEDLAKYCEEHPEVADAAHRLLDRNRGFGLHAGGVIISSKPITNTVPLLKRKDQPPASAWPEGLHTQDLQPVGLIKFDLLVISNLIQIAKGCHIVKETSKFDNPYLAVALADSVAEQVRRETGSGICALPGQSDWSDVRKWRNDPTALAMANKGDLKCIFQFDSVGIRKLAVAGGVDAFEDLVAYTALYRPGPLGMKMHDVYVQNKKDPTQRWRKDLHPLLRPILEKTYAVMTYQEQVMKILNIVGDIPLSDCEIVRKAMSKKKVEMFQEYKDQFILNGQKNLGWSEEAVANLWDQIESFSEYGFNKSHAVAYTYISSRLLYLKAHFPKQFYTAILSVEGLSDKIKEYKMEAKQHGVEIQRVNVNKSEEAFAMKDGEIYFGLSQVKGIGSEVATRIVQGQPYSSFEDFLNRFGTDANVIKPLVGLRCFKDADPVVLYKFSEYFKDKMKKHEDKDKRFAASMKKYDDQFHELIPEENRSLSEFETLKYEEFQSYDVDEPRFTEKEVECEPGEVGDYTKVVIKEIMEGVESEVEQHYKTVKVEKSWNRWKELQRLWNRRQKSIDRRDARLSEGFERPTLQEFFEKADEWEIDDKLLEELRSKIACESKYYGFAWRHELEKSPDFHSDLTFDQFRTDSLPEAPVEVKVVSVARVTSKKGNIYWRLQVEDVTGEENRVHVWEDDYERFQQEFKANNLLRLRLRPPDPPFTNYTFTSPPRRMRDMLPPKEDDHRLMVMAQGIDDDEDYLSDSEVLERFSGSSIF
jgi:DNA polymerase III alpha subunit